MPHTQFICDRSIWISSCCHSASSRGFPKSWLRISRCSATCASSATSARDRCKTSRRSFISSRSLRRSCEIVCANTVKSRWTWDTAIGIPPFATASPLRSEHPNSWHRPTAADQHPTHGSKERTTRRATGCSFFIKKG